MRHHSNFPLTATPDGNGTTLYIAPQLSARQTTAAASRAAKLVPVIGSVSSAVTLIIALWT